jgi:hypothetical protein
LPERLQQIILQKYKDELFYQEVDKFFRVYDVVPECTKKVKLSEFMRYTSALDDIRGTNFDAVFEEWSRLLHHG